MNEWREALIYKKVALANVCWCNFDISTHTYL
jgi:hypothetical protein